MVTFALSMSLHFFGSMKFMVTTEIFAPDLNLSLNKKKYRFQVVFHVTNSWQKREKKLLLIQTSQERRLLSTIQLTHYEMESTIFGVFCILINITQRIWKPNFIVLIFKTEFSFESDKKKKEVETQEKDEANWKCLKVIFLSLFSWKDGYNASLCHISAVDLIRFRKLSWPYKRWR